MDAPAPIKDLLANPPSEAGQQTGRARRSRLVGAFLTIVAAAAVTGGWYAHWNLVEHRFQTITPDKVYQSGAFPPEDLIETVREHGIRTVIDFRRGDDEQGTVVEEARVLTAAGVTHVHLPTGQVPPEETVAGFLQVMDDPSRYPVLLHCFHGEGRSSLFVALYRIEYEGWTNERARQATRLLPSLSSFSLDERKGAFLRDYVRRPPRKTAHQ